MERVKCVVIEDNILEFLDEIETQLSNGMICCKCNNPCEKDVNTKCRITMKNLLTDISMFKKAYIERNQIEEAIPEQTEKQQLLD